jgi:hypothetical protein
VTRYVIELNVPSEHVARAQFARVCDILTTDESARLVEVSRGYDDGPTGQVETRKVLAAHNMGEDG